MPQLGFSRHEQFAQLRAQGASGQEACEQVGLRPSSASRLERRPDVAARLRELRDSVEAADLSRRELIRWVGSIARSDPTDLLVKTGKGYTLRDLHTLPEGVRLSIASITTSKSGTTVKFINRIATCALLAKLLNDEEAHRLQPDEVPLVERLKFYAAQDEVAKQPSARSQSEPQPVQHEWWRDKSEDWKPNF